MGAPGKVKRPVTGLDLASIGMYAERYAKYKEIYRASDSGEWREDVTRGR